VLLPFILLAGCLTSTPAHLLAVTGDRCIDDFVAAAELPHVMEIEPGPPVHAPGGGPPLRFFQVSYGAAHDCQSGCSFSSARGLALGCDVAWYEVNDYEGTPSRRFRLLPAAARDALLLDERLWDALRRDDPGALNTILDWIVRRSDLPPAAYERARAAQRR
jgi:hypothetical protein